MPSNPQTRVLFVASEVHPLIKTGGLADVAGSLPGALRALGLDVRILLPGYPVAMERADAGTPLPEYTPGGHAQPIRLVEARLPNNEVPVYLVDSPAHFDRPGSPYTQADGTDWPDNAERFALLSRVAVDLALGRAGLDWQPDLVHCHDWQSGLVPALLSLEEQAPPTVFTIHNLAYQGVFPRADFDALGLPESLWNLGGLEFWDQMSFMKGGLSFADRLTTVSPTYAGEIQTPAFGWGLDALLRHRSDVLSGILNGVDYAYWDSANDPGLAAPFSVKKTAGRADNKRALQQQFGLPEIPSVPLVGHVGRLAEQKGLDLVLDALPTLMEQPLQMVILGTGDPELERRLAEAADTYDGRLAVKLAYSEETAHLIEGGSDIFLMPSRFEPCGLNQIYSLRYGAVPVVHKTGGLADTIVDCTPDTLRNGTANGFVFEHADTEGVIYGVQRALETFADARTWSKLMHNGMVRDFSWDNSARQYQTLYAGIIARP
ncbi:MAG: glycogen synthase GlgA [Gammaproteobacteria bacterium]